jgi:hypothetical protein
LLSIVAYARAGAEGEAWRRLEAGGFAADDPAALAVRGSLLKRRAASARDPEARRRLWSQAAQAYGRAADIQRTATYPFINAATLSLLAGDAAAARDRAERVLGLIEAGEDGPETPYWRGATQAEALLLLGRTDAARASLGEAVATAPRAWEDHASTLRQFGLILAERGEDAAWLDSLRPPRSLHFAGHMGVATEDAALAAQVREVLERERVGFGYGALGAGADILIAEQLLAHGAELHLVLPADAAAFAAESVTHYGADWTGRFEAVLARADTVETAASPESGAAGRQVAAEAAMGAAVMQAALLETEAVQLVVLDEPDTSGGLPGGSRWTARAWATAGRRQSVLVADRAAVAGPRLGSAADMVPLVLAELRLAEGPERLAGLTGALEGVALPAAPRWTGEGFALAFASPADAAHGLLALRAASGDEVRGGAWYGPMARVDDPFGGEALLVGEGQGLAARIAASAPLGAVLVTGPFAQALASGPAGVPRTEHVGDLAGHDLPLFALKP